MYFKRRHRAAAQCFPNTNLLSKYLEILLKYRFGFGSSGVRPKIGISNKVC